MSNFQQRFIDCNSAPFSGKKVLLTPIKSPEVSSSYLSTADSYQFVTDASGSITASIVPNLYRVDIAKPLPDHYFYLKATDTGSFLVSGSVQSGSAQGVDFDLQNLILDKTKVSLLTLTPQRNYVTDFSGSLMVLSSTASVPDATGSCLFSALVPGVYQCDAKGQKVTTTFYISVPTWESTGSQAPIWQSKDLLIVKPSKGIPVKLNNADNSFVLTVSASDARYYRVGGDAPTIYSASHALHADTASYIENLDLSGYMLSNATASTDAQWGGTASYANVAAIAMVGVTTQDSASWASRSFVSNTTEHIDSTTGSVTITDATNVVSLYLAGNTGTGGKTATLQSTPAGLVIGLEGNGSLMLGGDIQMGNFDINMGDGKVLGTASFADSCSVAVSSSHSMTASYLLGSGSINHAVYSDVAGFALVAETTDNVNIWNDNGSDFSPLLMTAFDGTFPGMNGVNRSTASYQPSTDTIRARNFQGTASRAVTASNALAAGKVFTEEAVVNGELYPALFTNNGPSDQLVWNTSNVTINPATGIVTANLNGTASVATTASIAIALPTSTTLRDPYLRWDNDAHSFYFIDESSGMPLYIAYSYNDGGNAQALMILSTASAYIHGPLGIEGNVTIDGTVNAAEFTGSFMNLNNASISPAGAVLAKSYATAMVSISDTGEITASSVTASLYGTASQALTASYLLNGTVIASGSSWNITSSQALTASYLIGGTVINSGSSWNITSSYSTKAVTSDTSSYFRSMPYSTFRWHMYMDTSNGNLVFDYV